MIALRTGTAEIVSLTDYYPYGMDMPGRSFQSEAYRYGYQGSERDPETSGGAGYTTYFRGLDTRIGRWLTPDPKVFPWQSPYVAMDANPIALIDPWGASTDGPDGGGSDFTTGTSGGSSGDESTRFSDSGAATPASNGPSLLSTGSMTPIFFEIDKLVFQKSGFASQVEFESMMEKGRSQVTEKNFNDRDFEYNLIGEYNKGTEEFSLFITRTTVSSSLGMSSGGDNVRLVLNTTGSLISTASDLLSPAGAYVEHVNNITPPQRMKRVMRSSNPHRIYDNRIADGKTTFRMYRMGRGLRLLGPIGSAFGTIMSIDKIMSSKEIDNWDMADALIGGISTVVGFTALAVSSPILAGVSAITGVYFLGRMVTDILKTPILVPIQSDFKLGEPLVFPNDNTTVGNNPMGGF